MALDFQGIPVRNLPNLVGTIPSIRREHRHYPLVAILPNSLEGLAPVLHQVYGAQGLTGIVVGTWNLRRQLRRLLTVEHRLPRQMAEWLLWRSFRHTRSRHLVEYILGLGAGVSLDETVYRQIGSRRTISSHLQHLGLPSADRIRRLGLCVRASVRVQRYSRRPLSHLAHGMDLSGSASLSRMIRREFGVTPTEIRGTLGWEWLLCRWVARNLN